MVADRPKLVRIDVGDDRHHGTVGIDFLAEPRKIADLAPERLAVPLAGRPVHLVAEPPAKDSRVALETPHVGHDGGSLPLHHRGIAVAKAVPPTPRATKGRPLRISCQPPSLISRTMTTPGVDGSSARACPAQVSSIVTATKAAA
jgi:hypothetical protein